MKLLMALREILKLALVDKDLFNLPIGATPSAKFSINS